MYDGYFPYYSSTDHLVGLFSIDWHRVWATVAISPVVIAKSGVEIPCVIPYTLHLSTILKQVFLNHLGHILLQNLIILYLL